MYFAKVFTFFRANYLHVKPTYFAFLILSHPSSDRPIAYINIVVDCILVEPAKAISPTLQFIFIIFSLYINYLDLATYFVKI
jgi:hypothetical protein